MPTRPALDPATVAERTGSGYPEPLRAPCVARGKRALGNQLGLTHFGVNLTRLEPGAWSAQRHWHTQQDEFVSEHASRLYPTQCAANNIDGLNDFDTSGYFYNGYFRNHYGSVRSDAGIAKVLAALERN